MRPKIYKDRKKMIRDLPRLLEERSVKVESGGEKQCQIVMAEAPGQEAGGQREENRDED